MNKVKNQPGRECVSAFSHNMKKVLNITVSQSIRNLTEYVASQWASSFPKTHPNNVYIEEKWNCKE